MKATEKTPEIDRLLTGIMGKSRVEVVSNAKCMTCDGEANKFRDELSIDEYRISGMCQACQDGVFGR